MVDDRNAGADEILLADEELFGPFRGVDVVVGLADELRGSVQAVMARDGFVGEHEAAVSVLDIDRLRKVADQEIDQQLEIGSGILVAGDLFESRATRRAGPDNERAGREL